jgi:hypothetical protein
MEFIKQLRPGIELFRVTVPTFLLQPVSLLEKVASYARPNEILEK